jgi:hypothetical protein
MPSHEVVNKLVIRLHKELDEASRTLGKVRRYGQPQAKFKLVSACRVRLESILSELVTLEQSYVEDNDRTVDPVGRGEGSDETPLAPGGPGPDQSGPGPVGGETSSVPQDTQ